MANVHILTVDGPEVTAIMHFAISAGNNTPGVPWRTIAVREFGGTTAMPDGDGTGGTISAVEKASVASGALVEVRVKMKLGTANPSGPQIDAAFAAEQTAFQVKFQADYVRYGTTR